MKRDRMTRIVATLGPASSDARMIPLLFQAGADMFRINMSHTSFDMAKALVERIRTVEQAFGRAIGILADLQGPKLRIGMFAQDQKHTLQNGEVFILDADPTPGTAMRVHLPHPEILKALDVGHALLIDDGKVRLRVKEVSAGRAITVVEVGGTVSNRKGVSTPDTLLPLAAMTDKDRADLDYMLGLGVDWIALSFVQRPEDVVEAKAIARGRAAIMAKIEKPQAVTQLADILAVADGLMVARGDLGVEMPLEKVPGIQKQIVRLARRAGKPVVVATQMLESMITAPVPTRAEVSDVASAVFEGADAVMLSAESAAGQFPIEAVETMGRIAREVESDVSYRQILQSLHTDHEATSPDAIAAAAHAVGGTLNVAAVCCYTSSGATALRMSRERSTIPVLALTPKRTTARRLAVSWGLHCVLTDDAHDLDDMVERACRIALREDFAKVGSRVIVMAGVPLGTPGATNMLRIADVKGEALLFEHTA